MMTSTDNTPSSFEQNVEYALSSRQVSLAYRILSALEQYTASTLLALHDDAKDPLWQQLALVISQGVAATLVKDLQGNAGVTADSQDSVNTTISGHLDTNDAGDDAGESHSAVDDINRIEKQARVLALYLNGLLLWRIGRFWRAYQLMEIAQEEGISMEVAEVTAVMAAHLGLKSHALFLSKAAGSFPLLSRQINLLPKWLGSSQEAILTTSPDVIASTALAMGAVGQYQPALDYLNSALRHHPENPDAWSALAVIQGNTGQHRKAVLAWLALASSNELNTAQACEMAVSLAFSGERKEAEALCDQLMAHTITSDDMTRDGISNDGISDSGHQKKANVPEANVPEANVSTDSASVDDTYQNQWHSVFLEAIKGASALGDPLLPNKRLIATVKHWSSQLHDIHIRDTPSKKVPATLAKQKPHHFALMVVIAKPLSGTVSEAFLPILAQAHSGGLSTAVVTLTSADHTISQWYPRVGYVRDLSGSDPHTVAHIINNDNPHWILFVEGLAEPKIAGLMGLLSSTVAPSRMIRLLGTPTSHQGKSDQALVRMPVLCSGEDSDDQRVSDDDNDDGDPVVIPVQCLLQLPNRPIAQDVTQNASHTSDKAAVEDKILPEAKATTIDPHSDDALGLYSGLVVALDSQSQESASQLSSADDNAGETQQLLSTTTIQRTKNTENTDPDDNSQLLANSDADMHTSSVHKNRIALLGPLALCDEQVCLFLCTLCERMPEITLHMASQGWHDGTKAVSDDSKASAANDDTPPQRLWKQHLAGNRVILHPTNEEALSVCGVALDLATLLPWIPALMALNTGKPVLAYPSVVAERRGAETLLRGNGLGSWVIPRDHPEKQANYVVDILHSWYAFDDRYEAAVGLCREACLAPLPSDSTLRLIRALSKSFPSDAKATPASLDVGSSSATTTNPDIVGSRAP